jgi:hypothetical protein
MKLVSNVDVCGGYNIVNPGYSTNISSQTFKAPLGYSTYYVNPVPTENVVKLNLASIYW